MKGDVTKYLLDYKHGKIKKGLGIDCTLDDYLRFKPKQLNIILGHDNVGKTYFINWYFLTLAVKHNLKFCIWSGENQKGQILRDMIQMYVGEKFAEIDDQKILSTLTYLEQFFEFIPNEKLYKPNDLLKIFKDSGCNAALIDPFTGLDREMSYSGNYEFLNQARQFVNETGITIYINTHPNSESGRTSNLYPDGHEWKGHLKPPLKDHIEGGKAFTNRCDDMFVIHRLIKHETKKYFTMINVEKIKDMDTGGKHTNLDEPILCNFNSGLGFEIGGVNPLQKFQTAKPNQFPSKLKLGNVPELMSTSEKIRIANENNLPF
jgi:hypothetical protein